MRLAAVLSSLGVLGVMATFTWAIRRSARNVLQGQQELHDANEYMELLQAVYRAAQLTTSSTPAQHADPEIGGRARHDRQRLAAAIAAVEAYEIRQLPSRS